MTTSKQGLEFLCSEEGCILKVYHCRPDPADKYTVGVGHVVLPGDNLHPGDTITRERCLELLQHDVRKCERAIDEHVTAELNQNQYDALVSLIFNIGTGGFAKSTVLERLNRGDYAGAADAFLMWCRAGADATFLLARRNRERAMFLRPMPTEELPAVTMFDLQQLVDITPHARQG